MGNVPFTREHATEHVDAMIAWFLGLSGDTAGRVTDFNSGSNIRTLLESIGLRLEHLDTKVYQGMRALIPLVLYEWLGDGDGGLTTSVGFPALPALAATGTGRFQRDPSFTDPVEIPAGTRLVAPRTGSAVPMTYPLLAPIIVNADTGDGIIQATTPGLGGSSVANTLTLLDAVDGIIGATNPTALVGRAAETSEARRLRFAAYIRNLARSQFGGLEVGALTTYLLAGGQVTERVVYARAVSVVDKRGIVDVFIDNGGGTASAALALETQRILDGYLDTFGTRVAGYKAAGVVVRVKPVVPQVVPVTVEVKLDPSFRFADVQAPVVTAVTDYIMGLGVFSDLVWTELTGVVSGVPGVVDHRLVTPTANVSATLGARIVAGAVAVSENTTL